MAERSIAAYKIVVHRRQKKEYLPLDNFTESGIDLLQVFHGYLTFLQEEGFDDSDNDTVLRSHEISRHHRHIRVTLARGEYGVRSQFEERGSGAPRFNRERTDVEMRNFRSLLILPKGREVGLFLTERVGNRGVYTAFSTGLRRAFRKSFPEYVVEVNNLAPEAALARILDQGEIKKIRLVRNQIPGDIADQYDLGQHERELGTFETVISAPRRRFLPKKAIAKVISGDAQVSSLLEWQEVNYDDLRLEVQVGRLSKTVSVSSGKTPLVTFDIDQELLDPEGDLADDVFYREALKIAVELAEDVSLTRTSVAEQQFSWPTSWNDYRLEVPPSEDAEP
ncbi:hypothetical protein [Streptomyces sp. UH6]|uniref:hypothetical protein n=1 Tax=Streptomyces sp. UH6 TaxID=2748379 RepID=UPI0015D476D3|nr:hypothetical protein [Streptomyces sp. UH6]NYV73454.1 hypothetical protein [Streptomyces sp. UH6]